MDIPNYQQNQNTRDIDLESYNSQAQETKKQPSTFQQCCGFLTIEQEQVQNRFYQPFFDVDQQDVVKRVYQSFKPVDDTFYESTKEKPDLQTFIIARYGPFWIYTTLVFMIFASGNLSMYLRGTAEYNFDYVPIAAGLIYGIGLFFPIVMCFIMRTFESQVNYIQFICIYGYSLTCFIPVILLCFIPIDALQWVLMIYGLINSIAFISINLKAQIQNYEDKRKYLVFGLTLGIQVVLVFMFKLYFFGKIYQY